MRLVSGAWFQVDGDDGYVQGPISFEQPVGSLPIVDDARWSADLTSNSWVALAVWLVLLVALQVAMWPVVRRVFSRFPDRGWAFGRLITLMTAGYAVWFLASVEAIAFRAVWCGLAVVLVGFVVHIRSRKRSAMAPLLHDGPWYRNSSIAAAELVFWAVFGLFLVFRLLNPDSYHPVWGGEKPMEFAHINAILRTAHFPPHDPWYADGILNYYYYGMYLVAFMMKVTGIPSEIAFNLAQPTMIAMLAAGAFSVASALTFAWTRSSTLSRIGGLVGVVLVSFSGNLVAAARLVLSIAEDSPPFADFNYWFWTPTRVLPGQTTIHEFPYFTGVYADLHAHVVALPMTVLAIALCFAIIGNGRGLNLAVFRPKAFPRQTIAVALTFGVLAMALASLFVTNAWDIPTYAAVTVASLLLATRTIRPMAARLGITTAFAIGIGVVAAAMVWPFSQHYVALYGAVEGTRSVTPLVTIEAHFGVFFLIALFGLSFLLSRLWIAPPLFCRPTVFVAIFTAVLFTRWYVVDRPEHWIELVDGLTVMVSVGWLLLGVILVVKDRLEFGIGAWLARLLVVAAWLVVLGGLAVGKPGFALFFGFGFAAGMIWLMLRPAAERFVAMLIAGGMFVGAGMELVYLVDGLSGGDYYRMNSVFKFYNGIWIMLALACAGLIAWMIHGLSEFSRELPNSSGERLMAATAHDLDGEDGISKAVTLSASEGSPREAHPTKSDSAETGNDRQQTRTGFAGGFFLRQNDGQVISQAAAKSSLTVAMADDADATSNEYHSDIGESSPHVAPDGYGMSRSWAQVGLVVAGIAIIASLAYPVFSTGARLGQHFAQPGGNWTLNALDWMDYGTIQEHGAGGVVYEYAEDRDVIEWFNSEVAGSPVIAEASFGQYRLAGSRIAIHTGLPVVVGWLGHQVQQRAATDLGQRHADLRTLYTSTDPEEKGSILDQYRIEYVVVGDLERNYPTDGFHSTDNNAGIAAFEPLVGSVLEVAFVSGETIVYRVIQG